MDDDGTRDFEIPENLFGPIDPKLPEAIGRVVMLAALLESKVAAIAMSVDNELQEHYWKASLHANIDVCTARFPLFDQTPFEVHAIAEARRFIADVLAIMQERNEIVHRVWPKAGLNGWGGHKASRAKVPSRRRGRGKSAGGLGWKDYTPGEMRDLIDRMAALADRGQDVVGLATALTRRYDMPAARRGFRQRWTAWRVRLGTAIAGDAQIAAKGRRGRPTTTKTSGTAL